ncbi:MAG: GTP cyclohydrolase II RibA [Hyphomicrobium sp.]|nr:GTP cyclohydrolase II RibA [Hyphomicrobium sp.]
MSSRELKSQALGIDWTVETFLPIEWMGKEVMLEAHAFQGAETDAQAIALIHRKEGGPAAGDAALPVVRVHSGCVTGDVFHSLRCDCHAQLKAALARIAEEPLGVLVYLPYQEGRGIGLFRKIKAYALQDEGLDTVDANLEQGVPIDARDYAFTGEILCSLGMRRIRLMTNNPDKLEALSEAGIEIAERIPLIVPPSPHNKAYLDTKRRRLSHKL